MHWNVWKKFSRICMDIKFSRVCWIFCGRCVKETCFALLVDGEMLYFYCSYVCLSLFGQLWLSQGANTCSDKQRLLQRSSLIKSHSTSAWLLDVLPCAHMASWAHEHQFSPWPVGWDTALCQLVGQHPPTQPSVQCLSSHFSSQGCRAGGAWLCLMLQSHA